MEDAPNSRVLHTFRCRWFVVLYSSLELFLFSGPTYGWAEFVIILKKENFFSSLCTPTPYLNVSTPIDDLSITCDKQSERLNLVFNVALCLTFCGGTFLCGLCLDKFGTRVTRTLGSFLLLCSGIFMALSLTYNENFIFPGLSLLQIAGSVFLISSFQVANLSERFGNTIIAVLNGCFDSSAMVLTFFKMIYFSGIPLLYIYIGYYVIAVGSTLAFNFYFLPSKYIPPIGMIKHFIRCKTTSGPTVEDKMIEDVDLELEEEQSSVNDYSQDGYCSNSVEEEDFKHGFRSRSSSFAQSQEMVSYGTSTCKIIKSRFYLWHAACFAIIHLRNWVFIGSMNNLLDVVSGHTTKQVELYTDLFGLIQCNGVFVNVLSGVAMDIIVRRTGSLLLSFTIMFFVTVTAGVIMSVASILNILEIQIVSFISYAILRGLVYNNYSGVIALLFPQEKMGILYGVGSMVGSWFASLQYVLFIIIQRPLGGNPFWVNVGLIGVILVAYGHPINMFLSYRKTQREKQERLPLLYSKSYDEVPIYNGYNTVQ